jgi:hypothetical protein
MVIGEPRTSLAQQIAQEVIEQVTPQVPVIIRRTIIKTDGTYPSGWKGSTAIENATYSSHAETTGFHADGQMNAEGFEFTSVDESDNYYEKLSGFVDAPDGITQLRLENSDGDATTLQTTGINTTGTIRGAVETVTVSPGSNISIVSQNVVRNCNIVSGYIRFTASAQVSAYAYVVTGLPAFATTAVFSLLNEYNGQYTSPVLYADANNTGLRVGAANMTAGTYNVSFCYICQ